MRLSILLTLLFVLLYVLRIYVSVFLTQLFLSPGTDLITELNSTLLTGGVWLSAAIILINFPLSFIAFLGEEYGWRYYFQPVCRKVWAQAGVIISDPVGRLASRRRFHVLYDDNRAADVHRPAHNLRFAVRFLRIRLHEDGEHLDRSPSCTS